MSLGIGAGAAAERDHSTEYQAVDDDLAAFNARGGWIGALRRLLGSNLTGYLLTFVLLIALWEAIVVIFSPPLYALPSPVQVADGLVKYRHLIFSNSLVTLRESVIGFGMSIVVGVPLGAAIAFSRIFEKLLYPVLVSTQAIPKIAVAPLLIVWFGFGPLTNAIVAVSIGVFPIIISTTLGLSLIDPDMVRLSQVMGANRRRLFFRVRAPLAAPSVFAGLKIAITLTIIGAVVGEFLAASSGLGYVVQQSTGNLQTVLTFDGLIVLSVMGIVLFGCIQLAERLLLPWHPQQQRLQEGGGG